MKKKTNPVDVLVGSRIRMRRLQLHKSQEWLADQIGLTFQQVQKYEKGTNRVGGSRMVQIAAALETSPGFFFEGAETAAQPDAHTLAIRDFLATRSGLAIVDAWPRVPPGVQAAILDLIEQTALPAAKVRRAA